MGKVYSVTMRGDVVERARRAADALALTVSGFVRSATMEKIRRVEAELRAENAGTDSRPDQGVP